MKQQKSKKLIWLSILFVAVSLLIMGCVGYTFAKKAVYSNIEDQLQNEANDWKLLAQSYENLIEAQGEQTRADTIESFKNLVAGQVIGESGYIWVADSDGVYVVSKDRLRDGEDISESRDADGVLFIQEAVRKAKAAGDGTSLQRYPWKNIGESKARMKVAGLAYMEEWDWVIGPSAYYDDFDTGSLKRVKTSLLIVGVILILVTIIFAFAFIDRKGKGGKQLKNNKLMAALSLIGVMVMVVGNILDSVTFWVYGDIYVGIIMAIASYIFFKSK